MSTARRSITLLLGLAAACGPSSPIHVDAGPLDEREDASLPRGFVWGVAELHSHPAIHLAFAGDEDGTGGTIWGHPGVTPDPSGVVPVQPSCDAETHLVSSPDQVQRATRALVFRLLSAVNSFPHSPYAGDRFALADGPDFVSPQSTWPHGRDLFHQQMHIEAIRRAYEGGLRLMIASATDNRTLSLFFRAPVFPGPPAFRIEEDRESAERQIRFIHDVVSRNADWMEIVTTPEQARTAIEEGRLAIVISLEMDALSIEDVEYFYSEWGARHVVPVHLADNNVGGTAAFNDLFNSHSALQSVLLGAPTPRYVAVEATDSVRFRYAWLLRIGAGIANFEPASLAYDDYRVLGYEPLPLCAHHDDGVAWGFGHRNAMGLRDSGYLQRLMELGMMVDVAHMGERTLEETFRITDGCALCGDENNRGYPLMDSHTGMFPDDERRSSERDINVAQARRIVRSGGVIGYGTAGEFGRFEGTTLHPPPTLFRALGGPLASFGRRDSRIFSRTAAPATCRVEHVAAASTVERTLRVPSPPTGIGYVRVEPCDPDESSEVIIECAAERCDAIPVPASTRSITIGWLQPEVCRTVTDDDGAWNVRRSDVALLDGATPLPIEGRPIPSECSSGAPDEVWFTLDVHRPSFTIASFGCEDRIDARRSEPPYCNACGAPPNGRDAGVDSGVDAGVPPDAGAFDGGLDGGLDDAGAAVRALCERSAPQVFDPDPVSARAGVVRVTVRSSGDPGVPNILRGATSTYVGTEVCARLIGGAAPLAHVTPWLRGGCPEVESGEQWFSMNRGATWGGGVSFAQYVRVAADRTGDVEGVELMVVAHDARWPRDWLVDEILVEDVGDPVLSWARYYSARLHDVYGAEPHADPLAAFALGTDMNGLAPQFPISSCHPGDDEGPFDCADDGELLVDHDGDPTTPPVRVPRPPDLRFRAADGSIVRMRFDERGMGGFGMLPDLFQLLYDYGQQTALDGLFRSAEATIRMWERAERWRRGQGCAHP